MNQNADATMAHSSRGGAMSLLDGDRAATASNWQAMRPASGNAPKPSRIPNAPAPPHLLRRR